MNEDHENRLKQDIQTVLDSSTWTILYSAVIICQTVLLTWDRWDTPAFTQRLLDLYYVFAQVFFLVEIVMLWLARESTQGLHFSQIVPIQSKVPSEQAEKDAAGTNDVADLRAGLERRDQAVADHVHSEARSGRGESVRGGSARGGSAQHQVDRAVVVIKVLLLGSGLLGVMTKQRAWTHTQSLRIFWPATQLLPVLSSLLSSSFKALLAIVNFLCFFMILMLCWAVVGRYVFFGDKLVKVSRSHFGDLGTVPEFPGTLTALH